MRISKPLLQWLLNNNKDWDRRSGRSTGEALETLGVAMQNPEKPVLFEDHFGEGNNKQSNSLQMEVAKRIVDKLDLKYFEFKRDATLNCFVTYNPFTELN